jgi:GntR family phosphonate transport system transcriptional regulator
MTMLARGSGVTIWRQIAEDLEADIAQGRFAPGSRLPTEAELAGRFGVNRHTLRRAIEALAERGLVRAVQGSGTFVETAPLAYPVGPRTRFSETIIGQAREPGGVLVEARTIGATADVADALKLAPSAPVLNLVTVLTVDGVPVSWGDIHVDGARYGELGTHYRALGSLTAAWTACGVTDYRRAWTRIGAGLADGRDAAMLQRAERRPVLIVDSLNVDAEGAPLQWTRSHMAADRMRLIVSTD